MRIELISEDIYSFAEVISEYETSVLTVKLRGRIWAISSSIRGVRHICQIYNSCVKPLLPTQAKVDTNSQHADQI